MRNVLARVALAALLVVAVTAAPAVQIEKDAEVLPAVHRKYGDQPIIDTEATSDDDDADADDDRGTGVHVVRIPASVIDRIFRNTFDNFHRTFFGAAPPSIGAAGGDDDTESVAGVPSSGSSGGFGGFGSFNPFGGEGFPFVRVNPIAFVPRLPQMPQLPQFPPLLPPGEGKTTSVTKTIDGHKAVINETVYGSENGPTFVRVRTIHVLPDDSTPTDGAAPREEKPQTSSTEQDPAGSTEPTTPASSRKPLVENEISKEATDSSEVRKPTAAATDGIESMAYKRDDIEPK